MWIGKFAKEGVPKSKNVRKQTCLGIKKYRGKGVSEIEMEDKYFSMRPTMHTCVAKNHNIHIWYEQDTYLPFKAKCKSPHNVDVWGYYVYCTMLMQGILCIW